MAAIPWIGTATTVLPKVRSAGGRRVLRPPLYYCQMARRVQQGGANYVLFDPAHVNWPDSRVTGWTPVDPAAPTGNWRRATTPVPAAVYENVFVHLAMKGYCTKLRVMAKARGIPLFNPPLPDKWRILRWLDTDEVRAHVPETNRLRDADAALRAIDKWQVAYVKPIGGYGGVGVTRVQAEAGGVYRVSTDRTHRQVRSSRRTMSRQQLRDWLRRRSRFAYLVQQGVDVLSLGGRRVDFRVVCQRNLDGEWEVVGTVPKLLAADGVVSNVIAGGSRISLAQCEQLAQKNGKSIPVGELESAALAIARALGKRQPRVGIIGFDLAVDESRRVFLIEANPKPARSLLDARQQRRSAELSAQFALYLANPHRTWRNR